MDCYNIIINTELINRDVFDSAVKSITEKCLSFKKPKSENHLVEPGSNFISIIKAVQDVEDLKEPQLEHNVKWTEVTKGDEPPACWHVPLCENSSENPSELLVERLHQLADHLPQIGVLVDLIWLYSDEVLPNIEDNIELYGALKRLVEWHNAKVTFLSLGSSGPTDVKDMAEPWVTVLRGQVTLVGDLDHQSSDILWRGSVNLVSRNIQKSICLPGFELRLRRRSGVGQDLLSILDEIVVTETKPAKNSPRRQQEDLPDILSSRMEVVAQLDIKEIPLLYFTGKCCHFCLTSESRQVDKSRDFLSALDENRRLCYLVRLNTGTSWRLPEIDKLYKDKERKEKKTWQDLVQDNMEHAFNCPCLPELDGKLSVHFFLLYSHDTDPCGLTEYPPNKYCSYQTCTAHLLRSASDISGEFVHSAVVASLSQSAQADDHDDGGEMRSFLDELPCVTGPVIQRLTEDIQTAQIGVIQQWIDKQISDNKSTEITIPEMLMLLKDLSNNIRTEIRKCPQTRNIPASSDDNKEENSVRESFPMTNLEKLVLEYQSDAENYFGRFKSNDSLAGLSPPTKGKVLTLSAAEFLKCFKSDGSRVKDSLSAVTLKKSNSKTLTKLGSGEMKEAAWPECGSYHYHDMYYNQVECEALEARSQQLKSRLHMMETSSTCNYRQVNSPATITVSTNQGQGDTEGVMVTACQSKSEDDSERHTRGSVKRKAVDELIRDGSKKLYAASKVQAASKSAAKHKAKPPNKDPSTESNKTAAEIEHDRRVSRSQRHKKKLEDVVKDTLREQGVGKDDPLFKSCALRLYTITKSFVKDLTNYQSLRQEMERIAQSNVKMIVEFERDCQARAKGK